MSARPTFLDAQQRWLTKNLAIAHPDTTSSMSRDPCTDKMGSNEQSNSHPVIKQETPSRSGSPGWTFADNQAPIVEQPKAQNKKRGSKAEDPTAAKRQRKMQDPNQAVTEVTIFKDKLANVTSNNKGLRFGLASSQNARALWKARFDLSEAERRKLREDFDTLQDQLNALQQKTNIQQAKMQKYTDSSKKLGRENVMLRQQIEEQIIEATKQDEEMAQIRAAQTEFQDRTNENITGLETNVRALEGDNKVLRSEKDQLRTNNILKELNKLKDRSHDEQNRPLENVHTMALKLIKNL